MPNDSSNFITFIIAITILIITYSIISLTNTPIPRTPYELRRRRNRSPDPLPIPPPANQEPLFVTAEPAPPRVPRPRNPPLQEAVLAQLEEELPPAYPEQYAQVRAYHLLRHLQGAGDFYLNNFWVEVNQEDWHLLSATYVEVSAQRREEAYRCLDILDELPFANYFHDDRHL